MQVIHKFDYMNLSIFSLHTIIIAKKINSYNFIWFSMRKYPNDILGLPFPEQELPCFFRRRIE